MKLTIPITPELRVQLLHAQSLEIELPEGWQLVPFWPTEAMIAAGNEAFWNGKDNATSIMGVYRAMLAAAPKPEGGDS